MFRWFRSGGFVSVFRVLCISQFQMRPAPPRADPREFAFFFLWMANSRGRGQLSCQMPGGRDETETANAPLYVMNQMRPIAKRDNSCTLKASDLAILAFEI